MRREGYLASLAFVDVLLFTELDNTGTEFNVSNPRWVGVLANLLFNFGYYSMFFSIISCVLTAFFALRTGTPSQIVFPTVMFLIGVSAFIGEVVIQDIGKWFNVMVTKTADGQEVTYGHVPKEMQVPQYLTAAVPCGLFLLLVVPHSISMWYSHVRRRAEMDAMGVEFEGAERSMEDDLERARVGRGVGKGSRRETGQSATATGSMFGGAVDAHGAYAAL